MVVVIIHQYKVEYFSLYYWFICSSFTHWVNGAKCWADEGKLRYTCYLWQPNRPILETNKSERRRRDSETRLCVPGKDMVILSSEGEGIRKDWENEVHIWAVSWKIKGIYSMKMVEKIFQMELAGSQCMGQEHFWRHGTRHWKDSECLRRGTP